MFANVIYSPHSFGGTEAYMILANVEIWNLVKEKPNKET
jgi:hypothetical protein